MMERRLMRKWIDRTRDTENANFHDAFNLILDFTSAFWEKLYNFTEIDHKETRIRVFSFKGALTVNEVVLVLELGVDV